MYKQDPKNVKLPLYTFSDLIGTETCFLDTTIFLKFIYDTNVDISGTNVDTSFNICIVLEIANLGTGEVGGSVGSFFNIFSSYTSGHGFAESTVGQLFGKSHFRTRFFFAFFNCFTFFLLSSILSTSLDFQGLISATCVSAAHPNPYFEENGSVSKSHYFLMT